MGHILILAKTLSPKFTQVPTGGRPGTSDLLISVLLDLCLNSTSVLRK